MLRRMVAFVLALVLYTDFVPIQARPDTTTRAAVQEYQPPPGADLIAIYSAARQAMLAGDDAQAAAILLWLWDHSLEREPAYVGVRMGSVASELGNLASRHDPTREAIRERRHQLQRAVDADPTGVDINKLRDWGRLNQILSDETATLAWWDKVKEATDDPGVSERAAAMELILRDPLLEHLRWAELARLYPDPELYSERRIELMQHLVKTYEQDEGLAALPIPQEQREQMRQRSLQRVRDSFREDVAVVYAALLAAERDDQAGKLAASAAVADETPAALRLALVDMAIGAGEIRAEHEAWLTEAEQQGHLAPQARQLRQWLANHRQQP